jgi:hypothetical protein
VVEKMLVEMVTQHGGDRNLPAAVTALRRDLALLFIPAALNVD